MRDEKLIQIPLDTAGHLSDYPPPRFQKNRAVGPVVSVFD